MANPVLLTTLGVLGGLVAAVFTVGFAGLDGNEMILAPLKRFASDGASRTPAPRPAEEATPDGQGAFSFCLRKAGASPEAALRDLLAYHDHEATLALTECLLNVEPQRFCPPNGGKAAADVMEIYLWSRDDARVGSTAHGLAEKIRLIDRAAQSGDPEHVDPFAQSWASPRDRALFDKLKSLAAEGYLDIGAFGYSGRADLREALHDVKPQGAPCAPLAHND